MRILVYVNIFVRAMIRNDEQNRHERRKKQTIASMSFKKPQRTFGNTNHLHSYLFFAVQEDLICVGWQPSKMKAGTIEGSQS